MVPSFIPVQRYDTIATGAMCHQFGCDIGIRVETAASSLVSSDKLYFQPHGHPTPTDVTRMLRDSVGNKGVVQCRETLQIHVVG